MVPAILLVHGFASSYRHGWERHGWADILADSGRQVLGLDLLGHGQAARPHDPAAYAAVGRGVEEAREDHKVVDAIGFSAGARLLLRAAVDAPSSFRKLVLVGIGDSVFEKPDHEVLITALLGAGSGDSRLERLRQLAHAHGNDPLALVAFLRRPEEPFSDPEIARVGSPALVITGGRDPIGDARRLRRRLPASSHLMLPDCDHFSLPSDPRVIDAACRFLDA